MKNCDVALITKKKPAVKKFVLFTTEIATAEYLK